MKSFELIDRMNCAGGTARAELERPLAATLPEFRGDAAEPLEALELSIVGLHVDAYRVPHASRAS